ncbi:hypothetical protein GW17_00062510, partial [Ensete ventricosum]
APGDHPCFGRACCMLFLLCCRTISSDSLRFDRDCASPSDVAHWASLLVTTCHLQASRVPSPAQSADPAPADATACRRSHEEAHVASPASIEEACPAVKALQGNGTDGRPLNSVNGVWALTYSGVAGAHQRAATDPFAEAFDRLLHGPHARGEHALQGVDWSSCGPAPTCSRDPLIIPPLVQRRYNADTSENGVSAKISGHGSDSARVTD